MSKIGGVASIVTLLGGFVFYEEKKGAKGIRLYKMLEEHYETFSGDKKKQVKFELKLSWVNSEIRTRIENAIKKESGKRAKKSIEKINISVKELKSEYVNYVEFFDDLDKVS